MTLLLHSYLYYSQHHQPTDPTIYCPLVWDLRESPASSARHVSKLERPLGRELSDPATYPPVTNLNITCDLFPETWSMEAINPGYVTLLDVLHVIYNALHQPLLDDEWSILSTKQQDRIEEAFQRRCNLAFKPPECEAAGKLRLDQLGHHTLFGRLSVSLEHENSCILSLRRPRP